MSRHRKAIRKDEYLAAALACLLPQDQRDALRRAKVPAKDVIRLFSPDHIGLHCFEAPDRDAWHNLHPRLRPDHREKSRRDTTIAAKVVRLRQAIAAKFDQFEASRPKRKIPQRKNPWPKRCFRATRKQNVRDISESR
jgi:hypothetical protein